VEAVEGKEYCQQLMDIDEAFGFRSSFQIVPEDRYSISDNLLATIVGRGFEINVHDLKHDGRLYADHEEFLTRAERINQYGRQFGACGFRSGVMYRNADWYEAFDFLYDMSIPNVAHLDPQRGGCCTVMPYFVGKTVELPLTCTQDYTLFNILGDYTIDLWVHQIGLIRANNGLVSVLVHPDYVIDGRAQDTYRSLLGYLAELRDNSRMWAPLPREAAKWWQQRSQMELVYEKGSWCVKGPGAERARVAYACIAYDSVAYSLDGDEVSAFW
jgi:hypothetical protein